MRRALAIAVAALALAGCGDKASSDAESPLDEALGFLPKDAPVVAAIETDPEGEQWQRVEKLVEKFPLVSGSVISSIQEDLRESGVDYEKDIKPILGNEAVVGVPELTNGEAEHYVVAIQAKEEDGLDKIFDRPEVRKVGEKDDFELYEDKEDGDFAARKDAVVVFADERAGLEAAIDTRGGEDRLREDDFEKGVGDLPDDALARVYGDLQSVIEADPDSASARKVPWVAALRTFGLALLAEDDGVRFDFAIKTEASELEPGDLPLAAGPAAPPVAGEPGELALGIRNPAQIVAFAQAAGQAVDPAGYGRFEAAKRQLGEALDLDVDRDVIGQFDGNAQLVVAPNERFAFRSDLKDPASFERTLEKGAKEIPQLMQSMRSGPVGVATPKAGEQFYALSLDSGETLLYGVVEGKFVLSNDPDRAAAIATAPTRAVPGGQGSVVFHANAQEFVNAFLSEQGGAAAGARLFTGPLGDLTGSVVTETSGMRGSIRLGIE